MTSRSAIAIAAVLTACGAVATASNDSVESAPQKNGGARGQTDDWPGEYAGDTDGGSGTVQIKSSAGGAYQVEITTVNPETGCGGSISGVGTVSGNRLSLSDTMSMGEYGKAICTMRLTRQGNRLNVSGEGDCHYWSGRSCSLTGNMTRRGQAPSAKGVPAAANAQPSIVGAWIHEGGYCASGDPIVFAAEGGYGNSAGDVEGQWALSGNALTVQFSDIDPTTGQPEGPPQRVVMRVTRISANEIRLDQDRMRRCPANGGAEPWHPGERFTTR